MLGGGILGRISNADDDKIAVVEIADKVKVRVLKKDIVDTKDAALKADDQKDQKDPKAGGDKGKKQDVKAEAKASSSKEKRA